MTRRKYSFREYLSPKVLTMTALGFSSGLPFLLTANTFGYWLRDAGTSLTAIGFISWVGLAYSFKYLWAPVVDRVDVPHIGFKYAENSGQMQPVREQAGTFADSIKLWSTP